jgi:SET domain-containing protein
VKLDLNSFNFTTPFYDRIGLYLHPYAALINHSCDYNAVIGFDGDKLFVKALKPINSGEQIFISYIDAEGPSALRRKELSERYYFNCQCTKCVNGSHSLEDSFLESSLDSSALGTAEEHTKTLIRSTSIGVNPSLAVDKLKSALSMLRETSAWPITNQPYVSILDDLVVSKLSARQFHSAFALATLRFLQVDPVLFLHNSHPIRQLHAWALVKLCLYISQGVDECAEDIFPLPKFELNFSLLLWSLLSRIVEKIDDACIVWSFKDEVRATFSEVCSEFRNHSLDPGAMRDEIEREWVKMGEVAEYAAQIDW